MILTSLISITSLIIAALLCPFFALRKSSPIRFFFAIWSVGTAAVGVAIVYREPLLWMFGVALAGSLVIISLSLLVRSPPKLYLPTVGYSLVYICLLAVCAGIRFQSLTRPTVALGSTNTFTHSTHGEIIIASSFPRTMAVADSTDIFPALDAERDAIWHQPALLSYVQSTLGKPISAQLTYQNRNYHLVGQPVNGQDSSPLQLLTLERE